MPLNPNIVLAAGQQGINYDPTLPMQTENALMQADLNRLKYASELQGLQQRQQFNALVQGNPEAVMNPDGSMNYGMLANLAMRAGDMGGAQTYAKAGIDARKAGKEAQKLDAEIGLKELETREKKLDIIGSRMMFVKSLQPEARKEAYTAIYNRMAADDQDFADSMPPPEMYQPGMEDQIIFASMDAKDALAAQLAEVGKTKPLPPDVAAQQKDIKRAGRSVTEVNVGAENSFGKEFGKQNAQAFFERRAAAQDAVASLASNEEARRLLDDGVVTGFGADFKLSVGKALQAAGFSFAEDPIANTEAFMASRAQEVGRIIKLFGAGTGLSDADRAFAEKAAAGKISMTEASMRRILDINDRAAKNVVKVFNEDASHIDPSMSPFPLTVEIPEAAAVPDVQPDEQALEAKLQSAFPGAKLIKVIPDADP